MGTDGAEGRSGPRGRKIRREKGSFLCLPHCLPARSLPLSPHLAVLPLTSSRRPLFFFVSFVALPSSHSLFTSFCLAGIYLEMITPPFLRLPPYSLLGLPFHLRALSASLSIIPSLHYYQNGCCGNRFIWKWREGNYSCALSVHFDTPVCMRCSCQGVHARFLWMCVLAVCVRATHPFSEAPLMHAFHIWRALFVPNLCYRRRYHSYSQWGPLTQWQTQWPWQPQDQWWVIW